jgi:hypothetical protein
MTVSDIITLLTLIIALLAIISEKKRNHLKLKFGRLDYAIFAVSFILINYFVFYPLFYGRGYYFEFLYFDNFGLANPGRWAYIITIASLSYLLYKIWYSFYSFANLSKVRDFYQRQIEDNDVPLLLDELETYHKKDIIRLIKESPEYNEDDDRAAQFEWYHKKDFKEKVRIWIEITLARLIPQSWYNRSLYADDVLHNIINTPGFICHAANLRPFFFAEIITQFKKNRRGSFPENLFNDVLTELLRQKNYWLKKELKQAENFDSGQPEWFHEDNRLISALIKDVSVTEVNEVWRSFGDTAIHELEEARLKGAENNIYREYIHEEQLWDFRVKYAISFFQSLIPDAIKQQNTGTHFFLYYYDRITEQIVKSWELYPLPEDALEKSIGNEFVDTMYSNLLHWLELSNKNAHPGMFYDILNCIGNMLHILTESNVYPKKKKVALVDRLLNRYCHLTENEEIENLRVHFEKILLKPSMQVEDGDAYYEIFGEAWDKFDKIPHRSMAGDSDYFARLKDKVITPLGLDSDKY